MEPDSATGLELDDAQWDDWVVAQALVGATRVEVAALVDAIETPDAAGLAIDGGAQFHELYLASEFVAAAPTVAEEIVQLLADRQSYMDTANACFDKHLALRISTPAGDVDFIVGIDCWNLSAVFPDGDYAGYLQPAALERLAQLAHDTVPEVDISDLGQ